MQTIPKGRLWSPPAAEVLPSHRHHPGTIISDQGRTSHLSASAQRLGIPLSPSPHPYWEAAEREGAGLFETPVLAVSSLFLIGINSEPALGRLGKAGAGGDTDGHARGLAVGLGRRMLSSESCFGDSWSRKYSKSPGLYCAKHKSGDSDDPRQDHRGSRQKEGTPLEVP